MQKIQLVRPPETVASGRFLELQNLYFRAKDGEVHLWESVARVRSHGAVLILAKLIPSGRILLVRQFRPPAGGQVWEFPAGLLEPGESPETTAVRELKEETGYRGRVVGCTGPVFSSPGLSSETLYIARMEVEEECQEEPVPEFDGTELIETVAVMPSEIAAFLEEAERRGDSVDAKVKIFHLAGGYFS